MIPLRFPDGFPPDGGWNRFFLGVRWLGPDLSFFKELKAVQARRTPGEMAVWGGGSRQEIAEEISRILAKYLGWRSRFFLPDDSAAVAFHGPRFDRLDDDAAFEALLEMLARDFGVVAPPDFWSKFDESTLGECVDGFLALRGAGVAGSQTRPQPRRTS